MAVTDTGSVYSIASIPAPFNATAGKIYASPVHSLREGKKRKRHEIVVGVDGEAINVYNIQTQNVVTSNPIPPHSRLACPPCSVHIRASKGGISQRQTFVALQDDVSGSRCRLVCFSENLERSRGIESGLKPVKREIQIRPQTVISVDIVPASSSSDASQLGGVLVSYQNGAVDCVTADLTQLAWSFDAAGTTIVEHAVVVDSDSARRGILAGREDVVASLGLGFIESIQTDTVPLLCQILRTDQGLELKLFTVRTLVSGNIRAQKPGMQMVMEYQLPTSSPIRQKSDSTCDLNVASGKLYRLHGGRLTIYDLSKTLPRIVTHLGTSKSSISNFARLSSNLVAAVIGDKAVIYETRYGSVQDIVRVPSVPNSKKRRHDSSEIDVSLFEAISGFADLNLVLGFSGRELVAVQFTGNERDLKRLRSQSTPLAKVAGKGVAAVALQLAHSDESSKAFKAWKKELNAAIAASDNDQLEKMAADLLQLKASSEKTDEPSVDTPPEDDTELTAQSFDIQSINRRRVLYYLAKCFKVQENDDLSTSIQLVPALTSARVYKLFALTGFMTPLYLNRALQTQDHSEATSIIIQPGNIMEIINQFDTNFELLYEMLALSIHWDVDEVVRALKALTKSFDVDSDDETKLLTFPTSASSPSGDAPIDNDTQMTDPNAPEDLESAIEAESRAAEQEVLHAQATLSHGLEVRSAALSLTLGRLHAFPAAIVTRAMRAHMDRHEIIFFIHILRIELAQGGWTSRYTDGQHESQHNQPDSNPGVVDTSSPHASSTDRALKAIAEMLNCAVDAIGLSGWVIGLGGDTIATEELLDALRLETSAAIEGCYSAQSVQIMLTELDRYQALAASSREMIGVEGGAEGENAVMPVGGRIEAPVVKGRESKSAVKKSHHVIQRERSLRVEKYSFDRIRF